MIVIFALFACSLACVGLNQRKLAISFFIITLVLASLCFAHHMTSSLAISL